MQATVREQPDLHALVATRFQKSMSIPEQFFNAQAEQIAQACWAMARRFHLGGRLLAFGNGAWATDAQHVSVEFVHPVIVGKRALPAMALTNDSATISGLMSGQDAKNSFARQIQTLGRPQDIALGYSPDGNCENVNIALIAAHQKGLLTLALLGYDGGAIKRNQLSNAQNIDFCFIIPSDDPMVIQETHETLYHILWELVHVFFEHEGLLS